MKKGSFPTIMTTSGKHSIVERHGYVGDAIAIWKIAPKTWEVTDLAFGCRLFSLCLPQKEALEVAKSLDSKLSVETIAAACIFQYKNPYGYGYRWELCVNPDNQEAYDQLKEIVGSYR